MTVIAYSATDASKSDQYSLECLGPNDHGLYNPLVSWLEFRNTYEDLLVLEFNSASYVKHRSSALIAPGNSERVFFVFDPGQSASEIREFAVQVTEKKKQNTIKITFLLNPNWNIIATDFDISRDGYSFMNPSMIKLRIPLWGKTLEFGGYCHGMAETSALYYNYHSRLTPSETPPSLTASTYELPWEDGELAEEVRRRIEVHFWRQFVTPAARESLRMLLGKVDPDTQYNELEIALSHNEPIIVMMRFGIAFACHSVVAYKVVDTSRFKYVILYDNNVPYQEYGDPFAMFPYISYDSISKTFRFVSSLEEDDGDLYSWVAVEPIPLFGWVLVFTCPITVKITDSQGRTVSTTGINEIPDAQVITADEIKVFYLPLQDCYSIEIEGVSTGEMSFTNAVTFGERTLISSITDVPIMKGTRAYTQLDLSRNENIMAIDYNGDGTVDEVRSPDVFTVNITGNTPVGIDVEVPFPEEGVIVSFDHVSLAGHTSVATSMELPFEPPSGIEFLRKFYRCDTTAQYTGLITIQVSYDDTGLSRDQEEKLRLFRIADEGLATDITTNLDTQKNLITGRTDSLSYFGVGYSLGVVPPGKVVNHGPNPVPPEGCIFWLNLPDDAVEATLKIFDVDGALLASIPLDLTADRYPETGRWIPQDNQGRPLGTGLYLYLVEIVHADGTVTRSPVQKMVIQR